MAASTSLSFDESCLQTQVGFEETRQRVLYVVLPAYNEAASIDRVLASLDHLVEESGMAIHAIIVNDGSSDSTGDIIRNRQGLLPVTLVEHGTNQGLGRRCAAVCSRRSNMLQLMTSL